MSSVGISSGSPSQNFWDKKEEKKGEDLEATKKTFKRKTPQYSDICGF